ncbi:helix-turn-helix domain-containing protein [Cereibacter sphaeroides]|uniref:helix-turn-helix domain-containing protein n=1 Tax=Cereibacter sphaeroides TaxID=1063 RepID=UPI001F422E33|nr:helix-turn-helix transcriptional regulator [Cereibacter sphaeroides]MCE6950665.1 helix-turn-helix domain-containing protein [Cereibacter sphaeroides]MCE6959108.1 helix-turn-helix domain-containing protein [Cereibacter sphaeroides]MCE6968349.1 helix-turn-helix domain-containing protein [Cereibacter sphaeroides]MCE6974231.1 helix-turn-helix domain-containing protein [Cereibacter sphaeroides]
MAHPVDLEVGRRIRHRRWMLGMSQQQLARQLGIGFQQVQKYETGANRVSASRLWDIAKALDVPIAFFFGQERATPASPDAPDSCALDLVRHFLAIPEPKRRSLLNLAIVLGEGAA